MTQLVAVMGAALAAYLVGTLPTARLTARLVTRGRVDIGASGSGNPGGLNTMRVLGRGWGIAVIVVDLAKGVAASLLGWWIAGTPGAYAGAAAGVAGHVWPIWTRGRGGKGIATTGGVLGVVFPVVLPGLVVVLAGAVLVTHQARRAVWACGPVFLGAAFAWWLADWPNLWGPAPTIGLPLAALGISAAVLIAFARPDGTAGPE